MLIVRRPLSEELVISVVNLRKVTIEIDAIDECMLRVALEERLKTWKLTEEYWDQVEKIGDYEAFVDGEVEECSSLHEAQAMVGLWEQFINVVEEQLNDY